MYPLQRLTSILCLCAIIMRHQLYVAADGTSTHPTQDPILVSDSENSYISHVSCSMFAVYSPI